MNDLVIELGYYRYSVWSYTIHLRIQTIYGLNSVWTGTIY